MPASLPPVWREGPVHCGLALLYSPNPLFCEWASLSVRVFCRKVLCWWQMQASGLFLRWQLRLGTYSVGCVFFLTPDYIALWDSKTPHRPACERVSYCLETSPPSRLPPHDDGSPSLTLLSFIFYSTSFQKNGLPFWVPGILHQHYRSCFVELAQHSNDLLMNLWGRMWSPCFILLPSWDRPLSPPSWTSSTLSHPPKLLQSLVWVPWIMQQNSHWLSILHMVVHMCPCFSLHLTLSFLSPHCCP